MKKGETRNPNGRPKKEWSLTNAMREVLSEVDPVTKRERYLDLIETTIEHAKKGDATSKKLLWNYLEGMPTQQINQDITSGGEKISFNL